MLTKFFHQVVFIQRPCMSLVVVISILFLIQSPLFAQQNKLYDDLFSVSFPNEKEGWVCGRWGRILHSSDGGKTWAPQQSGTDYTFSSIYFVDSKIGWAVGDEGTIIHTEDGGKTWEKQKSPVPFFLMKVNFVSPLKGWIVTERTHILNTEDGGKTWKIQFKDEDYILQSISFCDPLHGWAVGEYGYIYHTQNGGATWKKQAGFFKLSDQTGKPEGGNFLFDVVAIDPQTVWAVGIDSYVVRTVDGGKTWKEIGTGVPKTPLFCVVFNRADVVAIGGRGVFLTSMDRGQNWAAPKFEPPVTYGWIYGIARRGDVSFAAVGSEGAIYLNTSNIWYRVVY